jgi:hypothetical protein
LGDDSLAISRPRAWSGTRPARGCTYPEVSAGRRTTSLIVATPPDDRVVGYRWYWVVIGAGLTYDDVVLP